MATIIGTTAADPCLKLQEALARFYGMNPAAEMFSTGTLEALGSAQNRSGTMYLTEGDGPRPALSTSNRTIQARYVPKTCEATGVTWSECSYGDPQDPLWKTANITVNRSADFGFDLSEDDYRNMCESLDDGWVAFFNAKYADAKARLNNLAVIDTVAAMGRYPKSGNNSVTSPITIPVATPAGAFNPAGFGLLRTMYNQMNVTQAPIIVGAGKLDYAANAGIYSGLTNLGLDGSKGQFPYFRDPSLNDVFFNDGDDHALTWMPGSIILAEWFEYPPNSIYEKTMTMIVNGVEVPEKSMGTIVMPDGTKWDMLYVYDCGVHKYRFRKWIGVAPLPSDAFGSCQPYNYALHVLLGCADLTCETINTIVGPGAQSS
jgi:hypothetical protein